MILPSDMHAPIEPTLRTTDTSDSGPVRTRTAPPTGSPVALPRDSFKRQRSPDAAFYDAGSLEAMRAARRPRSAEHAQYVQLQANSPAELATFVWDHSADERQAIGQGSTAFAFALPGFEQFVLRVPYQAPGADAAAPRALAKPLKLVQYHDPAFPAALARSSTIGMPRAVLVPADHPLATRAVVGPSDLPDHTARAPMTLVRNCPGAIPNAPYKTAAWDLLTGGSKGLNEGSDAFIEDEQLEDFSADHAALLARWNNGHPRTMGAAFSEHDRTVLMQFRKLQARVADRAKQADLAAELLTKPLPEREALLASFRAAPTAVATNLQRNQHGIAASYERYAAGHLAAMQELAELPQSSIDEAIRTLRVLHDTPYALDCDTTENVTIHPRTKRIQFFDFSRRHVREALANDISGFARMMLGAPDACPSHEYLMRQSDIAASGAHVEQFFTKIERAAAAEQIAWSSKDGGLVEAVRNFYQFP